MIDLSLKTFNVNLNTSRCSAQERHDQGLLLQHWLKQISHWSQYIYWQDKQKYLLLNALHTTATFFAELSAILYDLSFGVESRTSRTTGLDVHYKMRPVRCLYCITHTVSYQVDYARVLFYQGMVSCWSAYHSALSYNASTVCTLCIRPRQGQGLLRKSLLPVLTCSVLI